MIVLGNTNCADQRNGKDCPRCARAIEIPDEDRKHLDRMFNPKWLPVVSIVENSNATT